MEHDQDPFTDASGRVCCMRNGRMIVLHDIIKGMSSERRHDVDEYCAIYGVLWEKAHAEKGDEGFRGSKPGAAFHEAGHLVVEKIDGRTAEWAAIWRGAHGWAGWNQGNGPIYAIGVTAPPENNIKAARQVMAGYVSERMFGVTHPGSSIDERAMASMLCMWAVGARNMLDAEEKACRLLAQTEEAVGELLWRNEAHVRAIARALVRAVPIGNRHKLQGRKLQVLLERVA